MRYKAKATGTFLVFLVLALLTSTASAAISVSIQSVEVPPGEERTAGIVAHNVTNLTQFGIILDYDPAVVNATGAVNNPNFPDEFIPGYSLHDFSHASEGYVLLGSNPITAIPQSGTDVLLTTVTLKAVGSSGTSALGLTIATLRDDAGDVSAAVINGTFEMIEDTTPPDITDVANTTPTTDSVTITWTTDEDSDSLVKYGIGTYTDDKSSTAMVTSHSITLTGLSIGTTHYFVVNSTDASGNSGQSSEHSFRTAATTPDTTPLVITTNPTSVLVDTTTNIVFTVTSDGSPVVGATVTLSGCGVETSGTTGAGGTVTIPVTATSTGSIGVTASKAEHEGAITNVNVNIASMAVSADPASVLVDTTTNVVFTVTSDGSPVVGATVTLSGCGVETSGTTGAGGTVTIPVTATSTGTISVTASKTGYEGAITNVNVNIASMAVSADPASVLVNIPTDVTFTVTSDGSPVVGATVTLSGCGVETSGTTGAGGTVTIPVTATSTGSIGVTASKTGYEGAITNVNVNIASMAVSANPTSVLVDIPTDIVFTVTSGDSPVAGATVTLSGCGVDTSDTTGTGGTVTIPVTATITGSIGVTASKTGYEGAITNVGVTTHAAPTIASGDPASPVSDIAGATRRFSIMVDQTVNVTWLINGTQVQLNVSVTEASYTNTSAVPGRWNVSAVAENENGTDMQTWIWNVAETTGVSVTGKTNFTAASGDANVTGNFSNSLSGWINVTDTGDDPAASPDVNTSTLRAGLGDPDVFVSSVYINVSLSNIEDELLNGNGSMRIELHYTDAKLDALGITDENSLDIYKFNTTTDMWELVRTQSYCIDSGRDTTANYVYVEVTELCTFALVGKSSAPTLVTYTITNTTITPPQTTSIDVRFSERVSAIIKIEDASGNLVNELYTSSGVTDPDPQTWDGTYTNGTTVPDGTYTVNVSGVSTTTGLSVIDTSKTIKVLAAGTVSVTLYEGWNLIAVPVNDPTADTAAELASKIDGCKEVVKWDATEAKYVPYTRIGDDWTGTDFAITGDMGIFVNVEGATTVGFTGVAWS